MKIAIVAGGTGGHIYPAITLADELRNRGNDIVFIGSKTRMEKDVIPEYGFKFIGLNVEMAKGNIFHKIYAAFTIMLSYFNSIRILKGYDLAIGFGNYISVPVILAAKSLKIKTVIHEQNSFAGKANLFLDKRVDLVIGSYGENKKQFKNPNTLILGNPQSAKAFNVKKDEKAISSLGLDPSKKTVVIFMGSLGSQTVNKIIKEYFKLTDGSYQIIYATGSQNYEDVKNSVKESDYLKYFERINGASVMKNSTLAVCRAGATTLCEITSLGVPAILIPSPYVPNNHQYYNGMSLVNNKAAILIEEKDLTAQKLKDTIDSIINNDAALSSLSKAALTLARPNVVEEIIEEIEKLWLKNF